MLKSAQLRLEISALAKRGEELMKIENMTDEQKSELQSITDKLNTLNDDLQQAETVENALRNTSGTPLKKAETTKAKTVGEHFVNSAKEQIKNRGQRYDIEVANAATDPILTTGLDMTQYDTDVVANFKRPTVSSVFGQGNVEGTSITYFVQTDVQDRKGATKEGALKNQRNYTFVQKTEALSKVTGFTKVSEEMIEDFSFIKSEIDGSLLHDVELDEEDQILNGDGVSPNLNGLLLNPGIQSSTAASSDANADEIYKAKTKIKNVTGFDADTIIINPNDYLKFRTKKDANGQYLGGGFFQGQYGNGGVISEPDLWATTTIQTPAIPEGKVLVGACKLGGTVYRKKGVRIAATNTNQDDFEKNMVTIRAEKRLLFAVKRPKAFYLVTLA